MESLKQGLLLSGGVDSICLAYGLKPDIAYTINYGQIPASREIYVSRYICNLLRIQHKVIEVNCKSLGSGILINEERLDISPSQEWWPYRNQLLITLAAMQAIKDKIGVLHLASVKSDSFHKDGTPQFYDLINELVKYQEGNISIVCESTGYYSHELVKKYNVPLEIIAFAHSCHISNTACGQCPGCKKQIKVRHELSI
ncbi:7-cyano-7-deazaguanine synthase [Sphingobacterium spiritivorum]|uniref:7-cyano-7-deazaguanine synthase n=1 Tax=Sphingobacterium spiritivorum ATCC 33861 TaxID=525373 RepID=D7VTP5_SPHSI|nr:7-cyano-7-deazaguanine synthase [Sphingobacterium spiritivorum]EFK55804.1 ExsB [Sphingobacterium spiritivorum ATCC 33861]QQT37290.1 7-cyano-7-deazaguanine synthase [Sphingobacterium spiritivorum]WQD34073.1 7-cyano-7-deazaguanine synthase [Sphingobacterium spiritivorum]SUJ29407.1 queuosine biosynthesis protein QueC [Sphingobacterium spiritivorum]